VSRRDVGRHADVAQGHRGRVKCSGAAALLNGWLPARPQGRRWIGWRTRALRLGLGRRPRGPEGSDWQLRAAWHRRGRLQRQACLDRVGVARLLRACHRGGPLFCCVAFTRGCRKNPSSYAASLRGGRAVMPEAPIRRRTPTCGVSHGPWRGRLPSGCTGNTSLGHLCDSLRRKRKSLAPATHAARMKAAVSDERQRGAQAAACASAERLWRLTIAGAS
jgi:hypothetical protein